MPEESLPLKAINRMSPLIGIRSRLRAICRAHSLRALRRPPRHSYHSLERQRRSTDHSAQVRPFRNSRVSRSPLLIPLSGGATCLGETAENSQEKPWVSGATMTVHAAGRNSLCSDSQTWTVRKTNRIFGINGREPDHNYVNEKWGRTLANRTVARKPSAGGYSI